METVTLIGYLAAICSMTSFTPQAWKIIKTPDTSGISAPMYAVTVVGFSLWLAFGIMRGEWSITVTNAVCLVLSAFILLMTMLPRKPKEAIADAFDPEEADAGSVDRNRDDNDPRGAWPRGAHSC